MLVSPPQTCRVIRLEQWGWFPMLGLSDTLKVLQTCQTTAPQPTAFTGISELFSSAWAPVSTCSPPSPVHLVAAGSCPNTHFPFRPHLTPSEPASVTEMSLTRDQVSLFLQQNDTSGDESASQRLEPTEEHGRAG